MSRTVAIIGATGTLGACSAFTIGYAGVADTLILIPHTRVNLAKLYQYDLQTSFACMNTTDFRVGTYEDLPQADVIVVCAGPPWRQVTNRMEWLFESLPVTEEVAEALRRCQARGVVINLTNPVDPTNWLLQRASRLPRERVIGYSFNDSLRFRHLLGLFLRVPGPSVDAMVIGEHGAHQVPLFSSVRINGQSTEVPQAVRDQVLAEIPKIVPKLESLGQGRMTGWTCSIGVAAQVKAILDDTGEIFPCSVMLDGEYGHKGISVTVPVKIGRSGVQGFPKLNLEAVEQQKLDKCFEVHEQLVKTLEARYPTAAAARA
jgi:malate dehydrogenase